MDINDYILRKLNNHVSADLDTFCTAPWYNVYVAPDKKIAPCCNFTPDGFDYTYNQLDEYFNSSQLKKLRRDLLSGVKNKNCSSCWQDEKNGGDSLRKITNRTIIEGIQADVTSMSSQIQKPKVSAIKSFELVLGNLCNLKCVMCGPQYSSQLLAEANVHTDIKKLFPNKSFDQTKYNWPKQDDFVEWCNINLPDAIHIKFTGGEPFIIPWIQTVIDKIPDEQKKKCILHFTTNLTIVNLGLFENFKKFKEVWLSVSVEGSEETFEYLRYGHKWETLVTNIKLIKEMNIPNLHLMINHVLQTPSYHSILPMTKYFDSLQLEIHPIILSRPKYFQLSSLSKKAKQNFLDSSKNYNGYNKNFIDVARDLTIKNMEQDLEQKEKCTKHLEYFDQARKTSYKTIIPVDNFQ